MTPRYIILHHSLTEDGKTVSWNAIRQYHLKKGWSDIGYHYGIELVGNHYEVLVGRLQTEIGAHCRGMNGASLGICFVGNFDIEEPPLEQLNVGRRLIRSLMEVFGISNERVKGHCEYSQKSCPGKKFPLGEFTKGL